MLVKPDESGSWVLFVGAPIIDKSYRENKAGLAKKFLSEPKEFLQNDIDGHYAIIGYDSSQGRFYIASDWNSLIPVYYYLGKQGPLFCNSELLLAKLVNAEPDEFGFSQAIHQGNVWGDRTRFKGIRKLTACDLLTINKKLDL